MKFLQRHIKWIMLLSGALTATMLQALFMPQAALQGMYGDELNGPLAEIVVRNWGLLVALIGFLLIYAAFKPLYRPLVLTLAVITKTAFISLNLIYGQQFLGTQLYVAMGFDVLCIALFSLYLIAARSNDSP